MGKGGGWKQNLSVLGVLSRQDCLSYRDALHVSVQNLSVLGVVCRQKCLSQRVHWQNLSALGISALLAEVSSRGSQAKSVRPRSALQPKSVCAWVEQQRV